MPTQSLPTTPSPRVVLDELPGDLQVKGWEKNEVAVEARGENRLELSATDDVVRLHGIGDCRLRVPHGASLEIAAVRGDARIGAIAGAVTIGEVSGDLRLRRVGAAHVQAVFGDLGAKGIDGDLSVGQVYGDAVANDVRGDVHLPSVGADLRIADVTGSVTALAGADAVIGILGAAPAASGKMEVKVEIRISDDEDGENGSATMSGAASGGGASVEGWAWMPESTGSTASAAPSAPIPPVPPVAPIPPVPPIPPTVGSSAAETAESAEVGTPAANRAYDIRAGADIILRVPADVGVTVTASSGARDIGVRLPGAEVERGEGTARLVAGDGAVPVALAAGGSVVVTAAAVEARVDEQVWRDMGQQFRTMGDAWKDMGEQFRSMASEFAGRLETQINMMAGQLNERLGHVSETLPEVLIAAGLSDTDAERIAAQVRVAGERAAERAQRGAERAAERAQRAAEAAGRQAEAHARQAAVRGVPPGAEAVGERPGAKKWPPRPEPRAPEPAREPVSAEERMMILRMIEQGKLSAEEAERLLAAMTGRASAA